MRRLEHGQWLGHAAGALALALVLAACGNNNGDGNGNGNGGGNGNGSDSNGASDEPITLTIQTFGNFGYDAAIQQFMADNEHITVEHEVLSDRFDEYFDQTLLNLESGVGAGDVIGIDEGGMGLLMNRPQFFVDLGEYGLDARESDFPEWKWADGHDSEGRLVALGTDVGGMALCYRRDLFADAGLPTDRDEVAELLETWEDFVAVGEDFVAASDAAFVDSPNTIWNVRLYQAAAEHDNVTYFDRDNNLIVETNPAIRTAFDFVVELGEKSLSAQFQNWSDEWYAAMKAGDFATMGCPSWMPGGVIEPNSGEENAGNWDITRVPGGSGNWGGSWIGVTTQSEHPAGAAQLVDYLTSEAGHVSVFEEAGNMPSSLPAQQSDAVLGASSEYFSDAPVGEIFGASVEELAPVHLGELHQAVRDAVEAVVLAMDQGEITPDEAWDRLISEAERVSG